MALNSCSNTNNQQVVQRNVFSLNTYFEEEIHQTKNKINGTKYVSFNGKKDTLDLENFDPSKDLRSFIESDINKPSLLDQYKCDTLQKNGKNIFSYQALKNSLRTKSIEIISTNGSVEEISILNEDASILRNSSQRLNYRPSKGYTIQTQQKIRGQADSEYLIEVDFD